MKTSLKLSRRDLETKEKTRLLQEHKTQIEQQLVNVNAHTAELEQRAGKIATMQEEQVGERDKVLEELRQQREINDTLRKTCQEALQRTDHELPAQYFGNIKTTNNSASFAGSIDNPGGQNIKLQKFSGIETDGRSISAAGVVNGVDFAALAAAMRKSG